MHFIWAIIIGAIAGVIAENVLKFSMGWIMTIILGIVGGLVGTYLLIDILHLPLPEGTIGELISSAIGAIILLFGYKRIAGRS
jgi:uncharacterized membrane protein YeaQ/YmgE (transglycosylase-associated protein family)